MSDIIYIRRNIQGMSILGLWDFFNIQNPMKKILFNAYGKFCYLILTCFNISQFIEMYTVKEDMLLLMQNAGVSLLYVLIVIKTYTLMFRQERIGKLLDRIRQEETISLKKSEEEVKIYHEFVDENWFMTKGFTLVCFSTLVMFYIARPTEYFVMGPQKINHYKVPMIFSSWFPFDKYKSGNFLTAYVLQIISSTIGTYYVSMSDTFIVSLMIFAIGQFRMMQCAIRNLHNITEKEEKILDRSGLLDLYEKTVEIVKHHCRIIDYLEDLDGLINPIMFLNFFVCSLMIGSVGLEGIMAGPSIRLALSIYFLLALLIQLFLFYWHANEVTLESINVGYAVCDSEWYKFSTRVKKALLMMLLRSQKPCILSVGGFYAMSLATFLMILRATYSYLALFRKMYDRSDE